MFGLLGSSILQYLTGQPWPSQLSYLVLTTAPTRFILGMESSYGFSDFPEYEFLGFDEALFARDLFGIEFANGNELKLAVPTAVSLAIAGALVSIEQVVEFAIGADVVHLFTFVKSIIFADLERLHRLQTGLRFAGQ